MSSPKYLLLCGVGRSGTTVLRKALGLHPGLYYNGMENNIVQDVISCALRNCTMPSRKQSMVISQDQYNQAFLRLLNDVLWPDTARREGKTLMCAINPSADISDYMLEVFQDCKLVYLVRNGIEVIASRQRYASFAGSTFEQQCDVWLRTGGMLEWGRQYPDRFREFRYEWLVDESRIYQSFSELFEWIGLEQTDVCAKHVLSNRYHPTLDANDIPVANADYAAQDSRVRKQMSEERSSRWKTWSPEDLQLFETKCGPLMTRLGYPMPWKE